MTRTLPLNPFYEKSRLDQLVLPDLSIRASGDTHNQGMLGLFPFPTLGRGSLLSLALALATPRGVARARVISLNIRKDLQKGAKRFVHLLGLTVTVLELVDKQTEKEPNSLAATVAAMVKATLKPDGVDEERSVPRIIMGRRFFRGQSFLGMPLALRGGKVGLSGELCFSVDMVEHGFVT